MLIIEGADLVGKTTLAKALQAKIESSYGPVARIKFGMESAGKMTTGYLMNRISRGTICDRLHLSETIYALYARDVPPMLTPEEFRLVNRMIRNAGGFVVNVVANLKTYDRLLEQDHDRGEDFSKEACRLVNDAYFAISPGATPQQIKGQHFDRWYEAMVDIVDQRLNVQLNVNGDIKYVDDRDVRRIAHKYAEAQGWELRK